MPTREILICGDPVLRRKATRVREITDDLSRLIEEMTQTMLEAPGVGLAAPQVGDSVRAIVVRPDVDEDSEVICLINPEIVRRSEEREEGLEGCLSLPTLHGTVARSAAVTARGLDLSGKDVTLEAEGLLARVLQHEIDHLDGVLFLDLVEPDSLGWLVPDEKEEHGYRFEDATVEEVLQVFERLRRQRQARRATA